MPSQFKSLGYEVNNFVWICVLLDGVGGGGGVVDLVCWRSAVWIVCLDDEFMILCDDVVGCGVGERMGSWGGNLFITSSLVMVFEIFFKIALTVWAPMKTKLPSRQLYKAS